MNESDILGKDILLDHFITNDVRIGSSNDFKKANGRSNLTQAVFARLRTPRGSMKLHPDYGCRLHTLIGTTPNEFTLGLVRQHIREALLQESRIQSIEKIRVTYRDSLMTIIDCEIEVIPIDFEKPLNLIFPFFLDG
jgi:phage baseplate assembly protein W